MGKRCLLLLIVISGAIALKCGINPESPEIQPPDFLLNTLQFTGDSTGSGRQESRSLCREACDAKDPPFCQVTIAWDPPYSDSLLGYSVHRSISSGIPSGGSSEIVGSTTDTVFIDSTGLEWGTRYYYAVSALEPDSSVLWSNEADITMPSFQTPTPSVLSVLEDLPMGGCVLSWTRCPDDDFRSYALVRRRYESQTIGDTLAVIWSAEDTVFTDSLPEYYSPRFYHVVTSNESLYTANSNVLTYTPETLIPWRICDNWVAGQYSTINYLCLSLDGSSIFFQQYNEIGEDQPDEYLLRRLSTENLSIEGTVNFWGGTFCLCIAPEQDAVLIGLHTEYGDDYVQLRDSYDLGLLDYAVVDFRVTGVLAMPSGDRGLLVSYDSNAIVMDLQTMTLVDTLAYSFSNSRIVDGYGTYVMGLYGGLSRIDPVSLQIAASCGITPESDLVVSSSGELCIVSSDNIFYRLDPWTLATIDASPLPTGISRAATIDVDGEVYLYLWNYSEVPQVYRSSDMAYMGKIASAVDFDEVQLMAMLTNPIRMEIWCSYQDYSGGPFPDAGLCPITD